MYEECNLKLREEVAELKKLRHGDTDNAHSDCTDEFSVPVRFANGGNRGLASLKPPEPCHSPPPHSVLQLASSNEMNVHDDYNADRFLDSLRTKYLGSRTESSDTAGDDTSSQSDINDSVPTSALGKKKFHGPCRPKENKEKKLFKYVNVKGGVNTSPMSAFIPISSAPSSTCNSPIKYVTEEEVLKSKVKDKEGNVDLTAALALASHMFQKHKDCSSETPHRNDASSIEHIPAMPHRKKLWTEYFDDKRRKPYYYNEISGESSWDRPSAFKMSLYCEGGCIVDMDGNSMDENYLRAVDNISLYDSPLGSDVIEDSPKLVTTMLNGDQHSDDGDTHAVVDDDTTGHREDGVKYKENVCPDNTKDKIKKLWSEHFDIRRQKVYYYNNLTGQTTWDVPSVFELKLNVEGHDIVDEKGNVKEGHDNETSYEIGSKSTSSVKDLEIKLSTKSSDTLASSNLTPPLGLSPSHEIEWHELEKNKVELCKERVAHKGKSKNKPLWKELTDKISGDKYYYNRLTKSTTWTRPNEFELSLLYEKGEVCDRDGHHISGYKTSDIDHLLTNETINKEIEIVSCGDNNVAKLDIDKYHNDGNNDIKNDMDTNNLDGIDDFLIDMKRDDIDRDNSVQRIVLNNSHYEDTQSDIMADHASVSCSTDKSNHSDRSCLPYDHDEKTLLGSSFRKPLVSPKITLDKVSSSGEEANTSQMPYLTDSPTACSNDRTSDYSGDSNLRQSKEDEDMKGNSKGSITLIQDSDEGNVTQDKSSRRDCERRSPNVITLKLQSEPPESQCVGENVVPVPDFDCDGPFEIEEPTSVEDLVHSVREVDNELTFLPDHFEDSGICNIDASRQQELPQSISQDEYKKNNTNQKKKSKRRRLWNELTDSDSGETYYYNRLTKDTTWTRPSDHEMTLFCEKGKVYDDSGGLQEYKNKSDEISSMFVAGEHSDMIVDEDFTRRSTTQLCKSPSPPPFRNPAEGVDDERITDDCSDCTCESADLIQSNKQLDTATIHDTDLSSSHGECQPPVDFNSCIDVNEAMELANQIYEKHRGQIESKDPAENEQPDDLVDKIGHTSVRKKNKSRKTKGKSKKRSLWNEVIDASSGTSYYYNRVTRLTTWTRPSDYELSLFCDKGVVYDEHGQPI